MPQSHYATPAELAALIKMFREAKRWSQEQLADVSGLSPRTIQRIERGAPSDLDSRRALARAFGFDDIDALNKPVDIPSPEEIAAAQEEFEREHITLDALAVTTGRQLADLMQSTSADLSAPGFEMDRKAQEEFAALVDYLRDYRDCADLHSETNKLAVHDDLQAHIDALKALGVSLRYAIREVRLVTSSDPAAKPWPTAVLYLIAFPLGKEPAHFAAARKVVMGG